MIRGATWRAAIRRLLGLLAQERALIRAGEVTALIALAARIHAATDAISKRSAPDEESAARDLRSVREAAERNQRLLAALQGGVMAAQRDLARRGAAVRSLGYDSAGALRGADDAPRRDTRA